MSEKPDISHSIHTVRDHILRDPEAVLEDIDVMRALITAGGGTLGRNVVDLRGVLVERLESRLGRLEDTHRNVIAAAYDNLAGTNQIHRAVLAILDNTDFGAFLTAVGHDIPNILSVDSIRICLETSAAKPGAALGPNGELRRAILAIAPGQTEELLGLGHTNSRRGVSLRQSQPESKMIYGDDAHWIRSEALMRLDLGEGRAPGLLVFGAEDPHRFSSEQGVDLLTFFGGVFERVLRRFLS